MAKPNQQLEIKRASVVSFSLWRQRRARLAGWIAAEVKPSFRVGYLSLVPQAEIDDDEPEFAA